MKTVLLCAVLLVGGVVLLFSWVGAVAFLPLLGCGLMMMRPGPP